MPPLSNPATPARTFQSPQPLPLDKPPFLKGVWRRCLVVGAGMGGWVGEGWLVYEAYEVKEKGKLIVFYFAGFFFIFIFMKSLLKNF